MRWTLAILAFLLPALLAMSLLIQTRVSSKQDETKSKDNIRSLILMMVTRSDRGWPAGTGKNFVLAVLGANRPAVLDSEHVEAFFSPRSRMPRPRPEAYAEVTPESLRTRRFPHLTSYAGPAGPAASTSAQSGDPAQGIPLIADFSFEDGVIVGFSGSRVVFLDREDLGLGPDDPIVPGPTSKSPILRQLSLD